MKKLNKILLGSVLCALFFISFWVVLVDDASASTEAEIRRDIQALKVKLDDIAKDIDRILGGETASATCPGIPSGFRFTRQMGYGYKGVEVRYMQIIFNADPQTRVAISGVGSSGLESDMYGNMTKNAVRRFQAKYASEILYPWNIQAPTGYAGMQTIKKLNRILDGDVIIRRIPPEEAQRILNLLLEIKAEIEALRRRIDELGRGDKVRGTINCSTTTDNTIRITYDFVDGDDVTLFRGSTRINSWIADKASGSHTDSNLSPNNSYTYYLRNGRTSSSPQIDRVVCETSSGSAKEATGSISCSTTTDNTIRITYDFKDGDDVSLFRGSTRIYNWSADKASGSHTDSGLNADTSYTYYLRDGRTSSSPQIDRVVCSTDGGSSGTFSCGDDFVDERDNISYRTVKIGSQCWFAEDLRHNNGCLTTNTTYSNLLSGQNCIRQTSGHTALLYQWRTAMAGSTSESAQGLCPDGWHIPSHTEWKELERHLGMSQSDLNDSEWRFSGSVGAKLKNTNWGGTNSSGFSARPGGHYNPLGQSLFPGDYGYWWTSTMTSSTGAYHRTLRRDNASIGVFISHYNGASSIRCILSD